MADRNHAPLSTVAATTAAVLLGAATLLSVGCDDKPRVPAPSATTEPVDLPAPAPASRPTTQAFLDAPRKTLVLGTLPLTLEAPADWSFKTSGSAGAISMWAGGPTPDSDARLNVQPLAQVQTPTMLQALERSIAKERAENPSTVLMAELRPIGQARVLEKRVLSHVPASQVEVEEIEPGTKIKHAAIHQVPAEDYVDWSLMVFLPDGKEYTVTMLTFPGLTLKQYNTDRAFLEKMVKTLRYNAAPTAF